MSEAKFKKQRGSQFASYNNNGVGYKPENPIRGIT